jgi:hypothetical protein
VSDNRMSNHKQPQHSRRWIRTAAPADIRAALQRGELNDVLAGGDVEDTTDDPVPQLARADIVGMSPEQIRTAVQDGRLDAVLRGDDTP